MNQQEVKLAFQEIKKVCGHNQYISLDYSISRFDKILNKQREEEEFSVFDRVNDIYITAPTLDLLLKKYMLAIEEKQVLQAVAS